MSKLRAELEVVLNNMEINEEVRLEQVKSFLQDFEEETLKDDLFSFLEPVAENGRLEVLEYLVNLFREMEQEPENWKEVLKIGYSVVFSAVAGGHPEVLKYWVNLYKEVEEQEPGMLKEVMNVLNETQLEGEIYPYTIKLAIAIASEAGFTKEELKSVLEAMFSPESTEGMLACFGTEDTNGIIEGIIAQQDEILQMADDRLAQYNQIKKTQRLLTAVGENERLSIHTFFRPSVNDSPVNVLPSELRAEILSDALGIDKRIILKYEAGDFEAIKSESNLVKTLYPNWQERVEQRRQERAARERE
ncbi:MAG: hypothetical protein K0R63_1476 [Rickettsiales bacterium]|jgi:hypothetical protein|nr:hypothetical protein [Rickettsiales bacterium]